MLVKEYYSAQAFLNDYEKVMLEHETLSQLLLYSAYHNIQNEGTDQFIFGAVMDEQDIVLLFCNVAPYDLVIYTVGQMNLTVAVEALADYFGESHLKVHGIIALNDICLSFMERYKKHKNCSFVEKLGMDIMEIREVNEIKPVDGIYRLAAPEDAKLVAEWMIEFQMEALTSEMDYEAALKKAVKQIEEGKIHFLEDTEKKIVSMAIAARKLAKGITITYIYTPEEFRGKGYAAANIYHLSKELLEKGNEFCSLFVDKRNPLSNRAYEKVGYKVVGDCYEYKTVPTVIS